MRIRKYTEKDESELLMLWWDSWHSSASFKHPKSKAEWKSRWRDLIGSHEVAVVEIDQEIAGFAALNVELCVFSQIFVLPALKRKGVGSALFQWALARSNGKLSLKTLSENLESCSFYEKHGMLPSGTSVNDFNGREETVYAIGVDKH